MQWTIPKNFNGVEIGINSWSSTLTIEGVSSIEVKENAVFGKDPLSDTWEAVKDISQTIFVNLIIFFLTIFLIRQFIKMSVTSGKWPIKDIMSPMVDWIERAAKSAPVLPLQWWMSLNAMKQFSSGQTAKMTEKLGINNRWQFTAAEDRFEEYIGDKLNIQSSWRTSDYDKLDTTIKQNGDFMRTSIAIWWKRQEGLSLNGSTNRKGKFEEYMKTPAGKLAFIDEWWQWTTDFETTFNGNGDQQQKNRLALHNRMWGDAAAYPEKKTNTTNPPDYTTLISNVYHRNTEATQ